MNKTITKRWQSKGVRATLKVKDDGGYMYYRNMQGCKFTPAENEKHAQTFYELINKAKDFLKTMDLELKSF